MNTESNFNFLPDSGLPAQSPDELDEFAARLESDLDDIESRIKSSRLKQPEQTAELGEWMSALELVAQVRLACPSADWYRIHRALDLMIQEKDPSLVKDEEEELSFNVEALHALLEIATSTNKDFMVNANQKRLRQKVESAFDELSRALDDLDEKWLEKEEAEPYKPNKPRQPRSPRIKPELFEGENSLLEGGYLTAYMLAKEIRQRDEKNRAIMFKKVQNDLETLAPDLVTSLGNDRGGSRTYLHPQVVNWLRENVTAKTTHFTALMDEFLHFVYTWHKDNDRDVSEDFISRQNERRSKSQLAGERQAKGGVMRKFRLDDEGDMEEYFGDTEELEEDNYRPVREKFTRDQDFSDTGIVYQSGNKFEDIRWNGWERAEDIASRLAKEYDKTPEQIHGLLEILQDDRSYKMDFAVRELEDEQSLFCSVLVGPALEIELKRQGKTLIGQRAPRTAERPKDSRWHTTTSVIDLLRAEYPERDDYAILGCLVNCRHLFGDEWFRLAPSRSENRALENRFALECSEEAIEFMRLNLKEWDTREQEASHKSVTDKANQFYDLLQNDSGLTKEPRSLAQESVRYEHTIPVVTQVPFSHPHKVGEIYEKFVDKFEKLGVSSVFVVDYLNNSVDIHPEWFVRFQYKRNNKVEGALYCTKEWTEFLQEQLKLHLEEKRFDYDVKFGQKSDDL
jgi:hypothetical protein